MHVWHLLMQYFPSDAGVECNPCIWMVHHFLVTRDPAPTTVEDGYSRAILDKQLGKVPGSRLFTESWSGGSDILLSLSLSLQVRTRTKEKTGRLHDMRYSYSRP
ncbi:hypothetical protein ACFX2B_018856 [Malus domestica]